MHQESSAPPMNDRWRFADFELNLQRGELSRNGQGIPLRPKTFLLLRYLVSNPGRLISREELLDHLWAGVVVTEDSVTQCVRELRAALQDSGQRLIKTVPRRGYLLDTAVRADPGPPEAVVEAEPERAAGPEAAEGMPPRALPASRPVARRRPVLVALALVALAACMVVIGWRLSPVGIDRAAAAQRSIAVLPLAALADGSATVRGDGPPTALAQAVTEDLIVALSHLANTVVFSSASTARFVGDGDDGQAAGRLLGATHVLTGSVRRQADAVLIQVQLSRMDNGAVLWSDRFPYDGATAHWDWQLDIGQRVANALDTRFHETHLPAANPRGRLDAVEAAQRGMALVRSAVSREDLLRARALAEQALAVDPDSALALTALGFSYSVELGWRWGGDEREARVEAASAAFERAIALQPNYAQAYLGRSNILYMRGRIDDAVFACEQALVRWPNEPRALNRLAFLRLQQGRPAEVEPLVRLSLRLNPLETNQVSFAHFILGMARFHLRQDDDAYEEMRKVVASNPRHGFGWQWMAAIDALHGRDEQARRSLATFRQLIPGQTVASLKRTETSTAADFVRERERFYQGLARAGLEP